MVQAQIRAVSEVPRTEHRPPPAMSPGVPVGNPHCSSATVTAPIPLRYPNLDHLRLLIYVPDDPPEATA
jgi:hypothetical protein